MFARTRRLTLRPGWPEDAAALAAAIGQDAAASHGMGESACGVALLIYAHEGGTPRLIGSIGLTPEGDAHELVFRLAPDAWGRGYATEAAGAVVEMARHALPIRRLSATCVRDDAATARVLRKLGFRDAGRREVTLPRASGGTAESVVMELDVDCRRPAMPIAA